MLLGNGGGRRQRLQTSGPGPAGEQKAAPVSPHTFLRPSSRVTSTNPENTSVPPSKPPPPGSPSAPPWTVTPKVALTLLWAGRCCGNGEGPEGGAWVSTFLLSPGAAAHVNTHGADCGSAAHVPVPVSHMPVNKQTWFQLNR